MAAHRVSSRMGTSSLRMKDEKKRCDSEGIGAAAFSRRGLLLAAAAFFAFSPLSADEVANATTQKTPATRKHSANGRFSRRGRKSKKSFCTYKPSEGAGYAGGIVSAAMDGERCAEALAASLGL